MGKGLASAGHAFSKRGPRAEAGHHLRNQRDDEAVYDQVDATRSTPIARWAAVLAREGNEDG